MPLGETRGRWRCYVASEVGVKDGGGTATQQRWHSIVGEEEVGKVMALQIRRCGL